MRRKLLAQALIGIALAAWVAATTRAAGRERTGSWADGLFAERQHDFGNVPRGAKVRHSFVLTNNSPNPITILNLRVSCGCTSGHASVAVVPPGKAGVVEAEMDTRNFVGRKATTLFVTLHNGSEEVEIGLGVASNILSDIVLNPGGIDFGPIVRGQSPTLSLTIDRIGQPSWRVVKMVLRQQGPRRHARRDPARGRLGQLPARRLDQAGRPGRDRPRRDPAPHE